jgi:hypothetical protein
VSKFVAPPQVWIVAVPEIAGVQAKTCSGAASVAAQVPASVFVPLVVPATVAPPGGMTVGAAQAFV